MFWFAIEHGDHIFGHKQIVILHSKKISNSKKTRALGPKSITLTRLIMCLQITHGVRLQMTDIDYRNAARFASYFGFSNTVRYCERQLIEMKPESKTDHFEVAVKNNMRFYLAHQLKRIESKEQLVDILRKLDVEKMSSESMKAFVAKLFS
ncbi:hypothetical protein CAEBREN_20110 [Caenorhabditis brenneri]|uniref:BTB domain-containing protein n=1 Tax=Caenorhabditis brenneri TaxID=135651 RepID=G0ND26_CAEBE|nr:hypothetical protein CAEBREN_20110 [Caenorhabditis brenneri]